MHGVMDLTFILPDDFNISDLDCFIYDKGLWTARIPLKEDDLFAIYSYDGKTMNVDVRDGEGEKYALFSHPNPGAFASIIRDEVEAILSSLILPLQNMQFDMRKKVISLFKDKYGIEGETPWKDDDTSVVFRSLKNNKWIAIMLQIPSCKIGLKGEGKVDIVNIKHTESNVPCITDHRFIFPAWHMNKKSWITVLLSKELDWDYFASLVEESRTLVEG